MTRAPFKEEVLAMVWNLAALGVIAFFIHERDLSLWWLLLMFLCWAKPPREESK